MKSLKIGEQKDVQRIKIVKNAYFPRTFETFITFRTTVTQLTTTFLCEPTL